MSLERILLDSTNTQQITGSCGRFLPSQTVAIIFNGAKWGHFSHGIFWIFSISPGFSNPQLEMSKFHSPFCSRHLRLDGLKVSGHPRVNMGRNWSFSRSLWLGKLEKNMFHCPRLINEGYLDQSVSQSQPLPMSLNRLDFSCRFDGWRFARLAAILTHIANGP